MQHGAPEIALPKTLNRLMGLVQDPCNENLKPTFITEFIFLEHLKLITIKKIITEKWILETFQIQIYVLFYASQHSYLNT